MWLRNRNSLVKFLRVFITLVSHSYHPIPTQVASINNTYSTMNTFNIKNTNYVHRKKAEYTEKEVTIPFKTIPDNVQFQQDTLMKHATWVKHEICDIASASEYNPKYLL